MNVIVIPARSGSKRIKNKNIKILNNKPLITFLLDKFKGKKLKEKIYYKHTGYPGGIKSKTPEKIINSKKPEELIKLAVKRMLPGGPLAKKQLMKLKIYNGEKHPHEIHKPKLIEFEKMNKKNIAR